MSSHLGFVIAAIKTITLLLGGMISYRSYQAYQRTRERPLRALSWGFAIITLGTALAGLVDILSPFGFQVSVLISSSVMLLGFAVIIYSLRMESTQR